jgi:hypothetical protein
MKIVTNVQLANAGRCMLISLENWRAACRTAALRTDTSQHTSSTGFVSDDDTVPNIALGAGTDLLVFKEVSEFGGWAYSVGLPSIRREFSSRLILFPSGWRSSK